MPRKRFTPEQIIQTLREVEATGVMESFYKSLAKKRNAQQIIVFENEDPPKDLEDMIAHIHFSGDKEGKTRAGFYPVE